MGSISKAKVISFIIALIEVLIVFVANGIFDHEGIFFFCGSVGFACVWFGDEMGGWMGTVRLIAVRPTPGGVTRFFGWILLLLPVILVLYQLVSSCAE